MPAERRSRIDEIVRKAVRAGGTTHERAQDHGFMYSHGFEDLDGHIWKFNYMYPTQEDK